MNNVSSLILGVLLTMLYTLFWLCSPVPMDRAALSELEDARSNDEEQGFGDVLQVVKVL